MKSVVVILLLSVSGVEKLELKTNGQNCGEIAKAWREVNTTYRDCKNQGNFPHDGKLLIGHICE